jgi:serine protease Do
VKKDYWDIPLCSKNRQELDEDLINNLNTDFDENHENKPVRQPAKKSWWFKIVGLIVITAFIFIAFNNWALLFNLPSLDFIDRSRELARDPEIQKLQEAVVIINTNNSRGTGFNIDEGGLIITNHHVVENSRIAYVKFPQGSLYSGRIAASFPEIDLAVISIEGENLPVMEIETGTELAAGDTVTIIGNPLRLSHIVTEGEVIGMAALKDWEVPVLMIRATIHKGSSGSPVINSEGKVAAVIFAVLAEQEEITGLAVPIDYILEKSLFIFD